jgi:MerR family transcriptional regulator, redox-sensitive transcriptional activator SoxR
MSPPFQLSQQLKVGDVASRSGVAVSTIHFYEARGLIQGERSSGNHRLYPRAVLRRIAVIRIAQRAGIPLAVIKTYLDQIPANRTPTASDWRWLTSAWRELIDRRLESLIQLRGQLDRCIGCGCLSLTECPLRNADDHLGAEGPGPRLLSKGSE